MTGLVGWWPLHENSGTTAYDLSGNENHGTNSGTIQGVWGKGGLTSYKQSSDSDYVRLPSTDLGGYNNMTFSFWFRWDGEFESHLFRIRSTQAQLFDFQSNTGSPNVLVCNLDDSNGTSHTIEREIQNLNDLEANKWTHGAVTYEKGGEMKVYIDGENVASKNVDNYPVRNFSNDAYTKNNGYNQAFRGYIQDIRVYKRALTNAEIQTLHDWGNGDYTNREYHNGTDSGAVSRWKLDGDLTDSWSSNDGTDNTSAGYSTDAIKGKAKSFDGGNEYVDLGDKDVFQTFPLSYSAWFKLNSTGISQGLVEKGSISRAPGGGLFVQADNSLAWNAMNPETGDGCYQQQCSGGSVDSGTWNHVTGVWTGDNSDPLKLYLNGKEVGRAFNANSGLDPRVSLNIGKYGHTSGGHLNGDIDDVRIYNRALKPWEVFQLYQWGTKGRDMRKMTVNKRGV